LSDAQILKHHPDLTQADLTAAWSYYNQRAEEIDQAIKDDVAPPGIEALRHPGLHTR
jgi:hypothetical protein